MKKIYLYLLLFMIWGRAFSQDMYVKVPNLNSFHQPVKEITKALDANSTPEDKKHPEYGILPYNTQCRECVELINKRTIDSRFFIDKNGGSSIYSQKSYFPLNYKRSPNDVWHTIDPRLRADGQNSGVYVANNQPVPTKCDLKKKSTSLFSGGAEFEFNHDLRMYFFKDNLAYTKSDAGNYTNYSVGEEGLKVKNIWPGIDMQQVFRAGNIETSYIISAPLQLPIDEGWMVIEDHLKFPDEIKIEEAQKGHYNSSGYYDGDYLLKDKDGDTLFMIQKPTYVDAYAYGMQGMFKLTKGDGEYVLQTLVPVSWLNRKENTYPLIIDPTEIGQTKRGEFTSQGTTNYFQYGFTTVSLGSCNYNLTVSVPGKTTLTNAYVDLEYALTYDNTCGSPPLPAPYCTFSQVYQQVVCDSCHTSTGILACHPAAPPYTGTCTTDSNLVPSAHSILINSFVPNYLSCYPPQCPYYFIPFTLENQDSTCGDQCGYLCARGHVWIMTVEACTVNGSISVNPTHVCAGQPATFTATGNCGVPPYHYIWTPDQGATFDTIYGTNEYIVHPESSMGVACIIVDSCGGVSPITNTDSVFVVPTPPADAGRDTTLCEGGTVIIGGSPTTDSSATSIQWAGQDATVQSWLSSTTVANPVVTVPAGTVEDFYYVVTAIGPSCSRSDTVYINSVANPVAIIDSGGPTTFCVGKSVELLTEGAFTSYLWSNGAGGDSISVSQAGQYFVVVTDSNGCKDTSNSITVTTVVPPQFTVVPDTTIKFGDSVMLSTSLDLGSVSIDSFNWYPTLNISCIKCTEPTVSPQTDQYYGLTVYSHGCSNSDSALIHVILPNNFYIPNVFTPNGDGNNDEFYVECQSGVKVILFQVFDRLGEKVHDGTYPWDGTYKGKAAPAGVYVYIFKLGLFGDDSAIFRKGSVTLLR